MNCPYCGHGVLPTHRFCGACGRALDETKSTRDAESVYDNAVPVKRARLRVVRGSAQGSVYELGESQTSVGRSDGDIQFTDDPMVSPRHARFYYRDGRLFVEDSGSHNGTFLRLKQPVPLTDGEVFLCGEQVLRFSLYKPLAVHVGDDEAVFCGTPTKPWVYRLQQQLINGQSGLVVTTDSDSLRIGRSDCDLNFANDRFISHHHARIECRAGEHILRDLDSRNGTYFRLKKQVALSEGDYLFVGRQLLRVEQA